MRPSLTIARDVERIQRCIIAVEGVVQGVGFRPFVYRLARAHGLGGSIRNGLRGVLIEVEGKESAVASFLDELGSSAPPAARPRCRTIA